MISIIFTVYFLAFASGFSTIHISHSAKQQSRNQLCILSSASTESSKKADSKLVDDEFLTSFFDSEIDDNNFPPSLKLLLKSITELESGSDIRGRFVDHPRLGHPTAIARAIKNDPSNLPAFTPFAAHNLGFAFASMLKESLPHKKELVVCVGRDPRPHGDRLVDAFCRGAADVQNVKVVYTGIATTPAMSAFCRSSLCDGGVMATASHLPIDRNGLKFFTAEGGFEKDQIQTLIEKAKQYAPRWFDMSLIPPSSGSHGVFCSEHVTWMPEYEKQLKQAVMKEVGAASDNDQPLNGLKIVLNSGNGSGGFFAKFLADLGADVTASLHTQPDENFPAGIPNPEKQEMIDETIQACQESGADIGILLDTDADRCGMVLKTSKGYGALNGNRLIAMMGVIMARQSPGCAIVTDSVTSIGLASFLQDLGINHVRHVRGYANVIRKARFMTENKLANAEVAIETSGHCALQENGFLDDGTYTAIKIIGLLARERALDPNMLLLDLIADLQEAEFVREERLTLKDGSLDSAKRVFDIASSGIENLCAEQADWTLDEGNQEGIRVVTGNDGGYFMVRKSLHDPVLSIQIEATSLEDAKNLVVEPLVALFQSEEKIVSNLDFSALEGL